jgi:hypothetical protein
MLRLVPVDPSESHLCVQPGTKAVLLWQQVRLEDGANDQHRRHLDHAVADARHAPIELHSVATDLCVMLSFGVRSQSEQNQWLPRCR